MNGFKKKAGAFFRTLRECFVHSLVPLFMYLAMSGMLLVVIGRKADEAGNVAQGTVLTASIICGLIAVAYNAVMAWGCGGTHFEQLVSGNMKRRSAAELGSDLTITGYKAHKEYRPWKGFVIGLFIAWPVLVAGLLLGNYQAEILAQTTPKAAGVLIVIFTFLAGWATMPFRYLNAPHWGVSATLALIPVIVSGVFYIVGAYSRRASVAKKQALADRKSAEQAQKPKKINYGGLPGTKPKKKK
ncbi:MAG: hypothetical protein SPH68_03645 [Candidatus Borkfalkiaceae bacterium]|nr:hypothetical protein [Clostridia bacterium]MDY6223239.1 hypothetical protein [Christensenellaceae bacterium]